MATSPLRGFAPASPLLALKNSTKDFSERLYLLHLQPRSRDEHEEEARQDLRQRADADERGRRLRRDVLPPPAVRAVALVVLPAGLPVLEAPEGLGRPRARIAALAVFRVARLAVALPQELIRQGAL